MSRGSGDTTEVVYRLYETVDELTTVIENARSVPMSGGSCMVPRDVLLDLLDDLRESLPEEVRQAGRIVEQRTAILEQAQAEAEQLTGASREEAEQLVGEARRTRDEVLGMARRQRDEVMASTQADADAVLTQAEADADAMLVRAEADADAMRTDAQRRRDALLADAAEQQAQLLAAAAAEHERLVTETEVYRTAVARADELGAQTVAEVTRMRTEVDEYVDSRLADFGSTLERMLRSVEAARGNLRA
jgi:cell division septum initiation protein DivIVA